MSEFGLDRARQLAARSHTAAREALAEAGRGVDQPPATDELEQITDFIYTRTS